MAEEPAAGVSAWVWAEAPGVVVAVSEWVGAWATGGGLMVERSPPATATASVPSGPMEAYAQESATAAEAGAPPMIQVSVSSANTRMTRADRVRCGPCTTEIMSRTAPCARRSRRVLPPNEGRPARTGFDALSGHGHRGGNRCARYMPRWGVSQRSEFFVRPLNTSATPACT